MMDNREAFVPPTMQNRAPIVIGAEKHQHLLKRLFPDGATAEKLEGTTEIGFGQQMLRESSDTEVASVSNPPFPLNSTNYPQSSTPGNSKSNLDFVVERASTSDPMLVVEDKSKNKRNLVEIEDEESSNPAKSPKTREDETAHDNSRGAQRKIKSYFQPKAGEQGQSQQQNQQSLFQSTMNNSEELKSKSSQSNQSKSSSSGKSTSANSSTAVSTDFRKLYEKEKLAKEQVETKNQLLEAELRDWREKLRLNDEKNGRMIKLLEDQLRKSALLEFRRKRDQLATECVRLGKFVQLKLMNGNVAEHFEEGYAMKELQARSAELFRRKAELDSRKKQSTNSKRAANRKSSNDENADEADFDFDIYIESEAVKTHQDQLKKDELGLMEEKRILESEVALHQKELKRSTCEEHSRFFHKLPTLHGRYLLQSLLGRGGFSEVWKAMDLYELREVAVKIHQLNNSWNEDRKASYIKHITREYTIHRDMKHPRVVQLFDVFEIDNNSFATVLEFCPGTDLDERLKRHKFLSEKDAKVIFMQIMSGLKYLHRGGGLSAEEEGQEQQGGGAGGGGWNGSGSRKKMAIIHFDLKPANILFDENGDVKITDFGLSKIIDESHEGTSMELTSQGAGTYWYLPPECFDKTAPRISPKVDIWSAGVILYQMLYGKKPIGEGLAQEVMYKEGTVTNTTEIRFDDTKTIKVSEEAKEVIRACMQRDPKLRPDVMQLIGQYKYFRDADSKKRKSESNLTAI